MSFVLATGKGLNIDIKQGIGISINDDFTMSQIYTKFVTK